MFPQESPKSKTSITLPVAQGIGPMLDALPQKPKSSLTARDVVDMHRASILGALQKGYKFSDIAALMVKAGAKISGSTLAHYVRDRAPTAQTAGAAKEKAKAKSPAAQSKNTAPQPARDPMNQLSRPDHGAAMPAPTQGEGPAPSPAPQVSRLPG